MSKKRRSHAQKNRIIAGSVFANVTHPSVFAPSPAYSATPAAKNASSLERADAGAALGVELFDLGELGDALGMRAAVGAVAALGGGEGDVAHPEGDGGLAHAELLGDVREREVLRAQHARLFLLLDLAAIAHDASIANVCSIAPELGARRGAWGRKGA